MKTFIKLVAGGCLCLPCPNTALASPASAVRRVLFQGSLKTSALMCRYDF